MSKKLESKRIQTLSLEYSKGEASLNISIRKEKNRLEDFLMILDQATVDTKKALKELEHENL